MTNFLKNGYEVYVWNRDPKRLKPLISKGAKAVNSPKEATQLADLVFEVTGNDESSKSVWTKSDGILKGADSTKTLITCATLSVDWVEELAKLCAKQKLTFFDMPMTGGRGGAEAGRLTLLVGGDPKKLELLKKDLKAISELVRYFGKPGSGTKFKLILNTVQAIHTATLGEALSMAANAGLNVKEVGQALSERPGGLATVQAWNNFQNPPKQVNFSVKWITKDLTYARKMSQKIKTPIAQSVLNKLKSALDQGFGEKDWSVVNKLKD